MAAESPDQIVANVGRRIAELREARGWTQQEFAEKADFSVKWVQALERGDQNLSIKVLVRLAGLLKTRVADLFVPPTTSRPKGPGRPSGKRPRV